MAAFTVPPPKPATPQQASASGDLDTKFKKLDEARDWRQVELLLRRCYRSLAAVIA